MISRKNTVLPRIYILSLGYRGYDRNVMRVQAGSVRQDWPMNGADQRLKS